MALGGHHIDRLLPRHDAALDLEITWDVRTERGGLFRTHRDEISDRGVVRDLSLEGARVEVHTDRTHAVGDRVAVRFRGHDGEAEIKHCVSGPDDTTVFGVRFRGSHDFVDAVGSAVGELRGHSAELAMAWRRRN